MDLANQGWQHMRLLKVEIVVGAIQVGGHHRDEVGAILKVVALTKFQSGDFGNGIRLVGVLQLARQEAILGHRLGRLARVDAGAAQEEQFFYPLEVRLVDDIVLDLEVLVDKLSAVGIVGNDPAHPGSGEYHIFRLLVGEESRHQRLVEQVELPNGTPHQAGVTLPLQLTPNCRANQTQVPGHIDPRIRFHGPFQKITKQPASWCRPTCRITPGFIRKFPLTGFC